MKQPFNALQTFSFSKQLPSMKKKFAFTALLLFALLAQSRDSLLLQPVKTYYAKRKGYMGNVELRSQFGFEKTYARPDYCYYCEEVETTGENNFSLGIKTVHGWRFSNYLFTGAGVSVERNFAYKQTFAPVFLQLQSEFLKRRITPFVAAEIGYSFLIQEKKEQYLSYSKSTGGIYFSAAIGARIYTQSSASFFFSAGYLFHKSSSEWRYEYSPNNLYRIERLYERLQASVGVMF